MRLSPSAVAKSWINLCSLSSDSRFNLSDNWSKSSVLVIGEVRGVSRCVSTGGDSPTITIVSSSRSISESEASATDIEVLELGIRFEFLVSIIKLLLGYC